MKRETRNFLIKNLEVRAGEGGKAPTLVGYAAVFNSRSEDLGGWTELIAPGAFSKTLQENRKIKALAYHDWSLVLGSVGPGTLRLSVDEVGLRAEVDPPNTTYANDLIESVTRGDIDGMSFAFEPVIDEWLYNRETDDYSRTLKEVRLFEVSFVCYPGIQRHHGRPAGPYGGPGGRTISGPRTGEEKPAPRHSGRQSGT